MKSLYVMVEGPSDAAFLRRILPEDVLRSAQLVPAGGVTGIPSLARSILVRRKSPVAVVIDSDSIDPDVIEERQESIEEIIRAADSSVPIKVVAVVPEIEVWFFAVPEVLERIFGMNVPAELVSLGKRDPRGVIAQLAKSTKREWEILEAIDALDAREIQQIRAIPEVAELSNFLREMQKEYQAA